MDKRKKMISLIAGIMAAMILLSLILSIIPAVSAASSGEIKGQIKELESAQNEINQRLEELEQQLSDNQTEIQDIYARKATIDQEVALLHQQTDNINEQITAYNVLIADTQDELDNAQAQLAALNEKYRERIRAIEEGGNLTYWSVLFNASSFSDLLDRMAMIKEINDADTRRLNEMSAAAKKVENAKAELMAGKAEQEAARQDLLDTERELEAKRAEADRLLDELKARGEEFEAMIEEGEQNQAELMEQIAQKEKEYTEAQRKEWQAYIATATTAAPTQGSGGSSGGGTGGSGGTVNGITWLVPTSYVYVSSVFSEARMHPTLGYIRPHYGIDLAAYQGTPIVASRSGVVTTASYEHGGAGYYVSINHGDGYSTIYMHMTRYTVKAGDVVGAGQVIGYVGSTGASNGPHLHFGISYYGTYVNPANYIKF